MSLPPAQVLPVVATSADVQLLTGLFVLRGWSFAESTGSAAVTFELYDGTDETYPLVAAFGLAQATGTSLAIPGNGVIIRTGLFVEMLSGSVKGAVWYNAITHTADVELVTGDQGPYLVHPGV